MGRTKGTKGSEAGNLSVSKRGTKGRGKDQNSSINKTGFDGSMSAPWRKTVSIFKQPVTLVHTSKRDSKICKGEEAQARRSGGNGKKEKPLQLFWSKRLEGIRAMVPLDTFDRFSGEKTEYISSGLELANKIEPALSVIAEDSASASLFSVLNSFTTSTIVGQEASRKELDSNPWINTNAEQPFIKPYEIKEKDIQSQEERVLLQRRRLQEARKLLGS
ncbi:unnamed protein product [Dracunculus medinensis]|uniref:MBD_C domain-containing protein n=1 Tax=Dracunculus medinensis TaxID=318479 RepID=A0A0N4UAP4_DRAME|nr:unnamed protein product [Dracunculus medinensis]